MTAAVSRQVRRAEERFAAKVRAAENRVYDRIAVRKAKKLTPLAAGIVRQPYPADRYQPFRPTGKDWKAIAAEKERAKRAAGAA